MLKPEDLVGTWEMVEYYLEKDGERVYPLGEDCKGFLMYTPDGYVSAQQMATGRPAYASGDLHDGTPEEMAAAAHGYMAYAGRYEIAALDPETGDVTVRHTMNVSMNPTWLGQTQERNAHVEGGILTIHAPVNGAHLVWRKVQSA
ncbi:MAG: lipocalin-like domain-containing protein [Eggerthellaceae bacterium]